MSEHKYQFTIDASRLTDREESHDYLAEVLELPSYYGKNLDALYDCLTEMTDTEIIVDHADEAGEYYSQILEVMAEATEENDQLELTIQEDILEDEEAGSELRLRPYKPCDAEAIVEWCNKDEVIFRRWALDRFERFPITAKDLNEKYIQCNGDCEDADNFYPMTAFDEDGVAGHMMMRFLDKEKKVLRFGMVIISEDRRGKGYGRELISLALKYAFEILKVEKVTIGVVHDNLPAYRCYTSVGFDEVKMDSYETYHFFEEEWKILELEITEDTYLRSTGF